MLRRRGAWVLLRDAVIIQAFYVFVDFLEISDGLDHDFKFPIALSASAVGFLPDPSVAEVGELSISSV